MLYSAQHNGIDLSCVLIVGMLNLTLLSLQELIYSAKRGDLLKLSRLLGSNVNPNFRNGSYVSIHIVFRLLLCFLQCSNV